jgi:epidermal growth factor receptor substrate 15
LSPPMPQLGRAISTGTEHDDPILKKLTAMGYGRNDALAALEKFDYDINKVSDVNDPIPMHRLT